VKPESNRTENIELGKIGNENAMISIAFPNWRKFEADILSEENSKP